MEINIKFDSENENDLLLVGRISEAVSVSALLTRTELLSNEEGHATAKTEDENEQTHEQERPAQAEEESPAEEQVPQETEKPKRKRRTKAEIEAERSAKESEQVPESAPETEGVTTEQMDETQPAIETQPLVAEVDMPMENPRADEPKVLPYSEWQKLLLEKRVALGLCNADGNAVGAKNAEVRTLFVQYIYELCEPYGASKPKDLADDVRYKFYHEKFKNIQFDPVKGFYQGEPMPEELPF